MQNQGSAKFNQLVSEALNQAIIVASNAGSADLKNGTSQKLIASNAGSADLKNGTSQKLIASNTGMANLQSTNMQMMNNNVVTENFQNVLNNAGKRGRNTFNNTTSDQLSASTFLCNQASEVIKASAAGNMAESLSSSMRNPQRKIDQ